MNYYSHYFRMMLFLRLIFSIIQRMNQEKPVRNPNQARSRETKDKIIKAANKLFGEIGYFKTNTKQIAKEAGVPVGSVYAYFTDKKGILLESISNAHWQIQEGLSSPSNQHKADAEQDGEVRSYIEEILKSNIEIHKQLPLFHRDIKFLRTFEPEIAELLNRTEHRSYEQTKKMLLEMSNNIKINDIDAAAILVHRTIENFTHYLTYEETTIEHGRLIKQLADMISAYLTADINLPER